VSRTRTRTIAPVFTTNEDVYIADHKTNEYLVVESWPSWKIFVGNYLPLLLAVLLKMFWTPIMANARLMQPFIAMTRPHGALTREALFEGYLARDMNVLRMWRQGHWLSLVTMLNMAVITAIGPLSSEAIFLDTKYECEDPDFTSRNPCWPPRISMDKYIIRVLQALLALATVLGALTVMAVSKASSIYLMTDPSTIAGIASLVHHPILLHDLKSEKPDATTAQMEASMPKRIYALQQYLMNGKNPACGIAPLTGADYDLPVEQLLPRAVPNHSGSKPTKLWKRATNLRDIVVLVGTSVFTIGFFGVVVAYYKDGSDSPFNRFFNSDTFGPRFIMTGLATTVSLGFESLHQGTLLSP
jgi:hypothetical protein